MQCGFESHRGHRTRGVAGPAEWAMSHSGAAVPGGEVRHVSRPRRRTSPPNGQVAGVSSAAPKDTLKRSHQMLTLFSWVMSTSSGSG